MAILFIIALLLAWPTYGLCFLAYAVLMVLRGYVQAKPRMHLADKLRASRDVKAGVLRLLSWIEDKSKIEEFVHGIENPAAHHGVPKLFSPMTLQDPDLQQELLAYMGSLEAQGSSFTAQHMAAAERPPCTPGQPSTQPRATGEQLLPGSGQGLTLQDPPELRLSVDRSYRYQPAFIPGAVL